MKPVERVDDATASRLVLRLFLRRLIDNDVISPHADRHESLAVLCSLVVSLGVFVTFFLSTEYLSAFIQLPGPTALSALSDRFLFISASVTVSALATLMVWDALALEPRDVAILGPLPIPSRTITHAKLAAAFLFGTVFALALNAVPSVLYPLFLTLNLRGMDGRGILQLIVGQATSVVMAGLFGFCAILAARGVCRLALGERGFRRVSSTVQSSLVVGAVTALLLAPAVGKTVLHDWVAGATPARWPARPVLWFLGVNETVAGHIVAETPVVLPPRFSFVGFPRRQDDAGRAAYRALIPRFAALARRAWLSVPAVACLAIATFLWTNRRLPEQATAGVAESRLRGGIRRMAERLTEANPETQAGFFFTWQTLTRSQPHRTIIAIAVAAGLTHLLIALASGGMHGLGLRDIPLRLLGISSVVLVSLVAGLRYAVTVPPELASNWTIRMAWLGDEREYLAGVKRAAIAVLVIVPLLVLLPLHVALFGFGIAMVHSIYALMIAAAALDALFVTYRQFPFACSYVPIENPKLLWPVGLTSVLLFTYGFADVERFALQTATRTAGLGAALGAIVLLVKLIDRANRRHERLPVNFGARPAPATQRLGLFDRIANQD
jgi:hypothetical protein